MVEKQTISFHSSYLQNRSKYALHDAFRRSSRSELSNQLTKTTLENTTVEGRQMFEERCTMLDTDNDVKACLQIHHAAISKNVPEFSGLESPKGQRLLEDLDTKKHSATQVYRQVAFKLLQDGFCAIEVEAATREAQTQAESDASNERSYARLYQANDVLNWTYFEEDGPQKGELKTVIFRNRITNINGKLFQLYKEYSFFEGSSLYGIRIYKSKSEIKHLNESTGKIEVELYEEHQGTLTQIPVEFFGDPENGVDDTAIRDGVIDSLTILNKQSAYDLTCRNQGFTQRFISGDLDATDQATIAANVLSTIPGENVQVHTIEPSDPIATWRDLQRLRSRAKAKMMLQHNQMTNPESKNVSSADSKQADNQTRVEYYETLAEDLEQGFTAVFRLCAAYEGMPEDKINVIVSREFEMIDTEIEEQRKAMLWTKSGSFGKAGRMIQKCLLKNDVALMPIVAHDSETEDQIRKELFAAIDAEPDERQGPITSRLSELMNQQRQTQS